jgi:2-polyprenyl-3-methyl-5-hydroxy-6-metoxy-1,4-benzoquinol methylase
MPTYAQEARNSNKQELMPKRHWAENAWANAVHLPIVITPGACFGQHELYRHYLGGVRAGKIFEVGCAPGGWLAYFALNFGLQVHGIEYVEEGAQLTRQNLNLLGIEAKIICDDFFSCSLPTSNYDVVFSRGFIEHFSETQVVINRLASLARAGGLIVTTVPNFVGLNGSIRKVLAPESYAAHVKMDVKKMRDMHEAAGFSTYFCNYTGVPVLILPWDARGGDHKPATPVGKMVDLGKRLVNRLCKEICRRSKWVPGSRLLSPTILYIGRRRPGAG